MSDCITCPREHECGYKYKPCDCVHQRKYVPKSLKDCISSVSEPASLLHHFGTESIKLPIGKKS